MCHRHTPSSQRHLSSKIPPNLYQLIFNAYLVKCKKMTCITLNMQYMSPLEKVPFATFLPLTEVSARHMFFSKTTFSSGLIYWCSRVILCIQFYRLMQLIFSTLLYMFLSSRWILREFYVILLDYKRFIWKLHGLWTLMIITEPLLIHYWTITLEHEILLNRNVFW